jgi:hypothetical protein
MNQPPMRREQSVDAAVLEAGAAVANREAWVAGNPNASKGKAKHRLRHSQSWTPADTARTDAPGA